MELVDSIPVTITGSAEQSEWATLAFTQSDLSAIGDASMSPNTSPNSRSRNRGFADDFNLDDNEETKEELVDMGKAYFMKNILNSQAPDKDGIIENVNDAWEYVNNLMPKLSSLQTSQLKRLFVKHWPVLVEIYQNYAPLNTMMKREMTETDYFHFVEDAEIFPARDFEFLTKRSFRRISAGSRVLPIGGFIAAIIFLAQARHVDIFSKESPDLPKAVSAVTFIVENNLLSLALKLNSSAYFRLCFFDDKFLAGLRDMHENLFLVFEKYCAKITTEVTTNLPVDLVSQIFVDSKITPAPDPFYIADLLRTCRAGLINGRFFPEDSGMLSTREDEFQFAEFVEAIARSAFRTEGALEVAVSGKVVGAAMLENLKMVESLLWYKPEETAPTKGKK
jgi:hypothetical protein